jgi:hypothetical protein
MQEQPHARTRSGGHAAFIQDQPFPHPRSQSDSLGDGGRAPPPTLSRHPPTFVDGWHSDGLVLLGSVGFLDRFTVTASRFAQAVAVEDRDAFDDRFGVVHAA